MSKYLNALMLAAQAHDGQVRKGTAIPYITHPVEVAGLVAGYGGDEDQQIGALFHDVLEDCGAEWESRLAEYGERVLAIVHGCTDGTPDASGKKAPWRQRKEAYIAHLVHAPADVLLVSACDKLANLRAIRYDLEAIGLAVFDRFTADMDGVLWYYRKLVYTFVECGAAPADVLREELSAVFDLAHSATAAV